jgi:glycosyltransferase involved in cell wall biosynthesis
MRIALVHDYLVQYGGAERVLECFAEIWPHAPIYTLIYDPKAVHYKFDSKRVRTSFLQNIPFAKKHHRIFPPLMMLAIEQFNLDYYDVVLSDSSSFAKNIITGSKTLHISYCHTPMRYAWDDCQYYTEQFNFPGWIKRYIPFFMNYIRIWDYYAASGVDDFIANSNFVARRINKYYKREAQVIHPPVAVNDFYIGSQPQDYYLMVGRMMKYKRMDIVVEAFNRMKKPLKIIGRGMEFKQLKKLAGPTIDFLGRVSDQELFRYYSSAKAFIFPQEEDFGIVAIEALASGRPVIAYRAGDIVENIEEDKTGIFFDKQTSEDIIAAVNKFEKIDFDAQYIRQSVTKFDRQMFKESIRNYVEKSLMEFKKS